MTCPIRVRVRVRVKISVNSLLKNEPSFRRDTGLFVRLSSYISNPPIRVRVRVSWISGYKNQIIEEIGRNMYCIYIESMLLCVRVMGCLALPYAIRPGV